jgi:hypothetical protein
MAIKVIITRLCEGLRQRHKVIRPGFIRLGRPDQPAGNQIQNAEAATGAKNVSDIGRSSFVHRKTTKSPAKTNGATVNCVLRKRLVEVGEQADCPAAQNPKNQYGDSCQN